MKQTDYLQIYTSVTTKLDYSFRRFSVDKFFFNNISIFPPNSIILDMGGKKINKRGFFNIGNFDLVTKYANIDENTEPDYLCDITTVSEADAYFDGIILSEVLEHIKYPQKVLQEAYRLLKPNGSVLICTPFIFHIHADPFDYARYTPYWYQDILSSIGFTDIDIQKQGGFFCVLANMLKFYVYELYKGKQLQIIPKRFLYMKAISWLSKMALIWDESSFIQNNQILSGYTTGYGIVCKKGLE